VGEASRAEPELPAGGDVVWISFSLFLCILHAMSHVEVVQALEARRAARPSVQATREAYWYVNCDSPGVSVVERVKKFRVRVASGGDPKSRTSTPLSLLLFSLRNSGFSPRFVSSRLVMPSLPDPPDRGETSWTPFRQAEKHYKNRSTPRFPSLHGRGVVDLSRPDLEGDDEVWLAGWWCPDANPGLGSGLGSAGDSHSHSLGTSRRRRMRAWKGKERDRGERPETCLDGLRRLELSDGREAWVVAEGT
jgi:hypothetical protein